MLLFCNLSALVIHLGIGGRKLLDANILLRSYFETPRTIVSRTKIDSALIPTPLIIGGLRTGSATWIELSLVPFRHRKAGDLFVK